MKVKDNLLLIVLLGFSLESTLKDFIAFQFQMAEEKNLEAPLAPNDGRISPLADAVFKACADSGKQSHAHTSRPSTM